MERREYEILERLERSYWWHRVLHKVLLERIREAPRGIVIDLGAGTGGLVESTRLASYTSFGIDYAHQAAACWGRRGIPGVQGDANRLPLASRCASIVVSVDLICQRDADPASLLGEARRILVPGGRLIMTAPAFAWLSSAHDRAVHASRRFTRAGLRELIRRSGFMVREARYFFASTFPALVAVRALKAVLKPDDPLSDLRPLPGALNRFLEAVGDAERRLPRAISLPFGSTVLVVADRNGS